MLLQGDGNGCRGACECCYRVMAAGAIREYSVVCE
ncbi:unknown [Roseburia sp. CAG:380]|nr:unknown [Roseburia sp. CAG:380]